MVGLVRCVPVSVPFSDLLKSWGGVWRAHIWYVWATVECTDVLIQACVLSVARACVIDIIVHLAGTWAVEYSAAEHMASLI